MAVCTFFLRGQCKFGDKCRNDHPPGEQRQGGFGSQTWSNPNRTNNAGASNSKLPLPFSMDVMKSDLTPLMDKPLWPLSSYGPAKHEPILLGGLDESPEELRFRANTATQSGNTNEYTTYETNKIAAAEQVFANARNNLAQAFETASKQSAHSALFAANGTSSNTTTTSAFGTSSAFGASASTPSAFGSTTATPSTFGGGSTFGQSAFGQSTFGQTTTPATSAFGQPSQPTSVFGQPTSAQPPKKVDMVAAFAKLQSAYKPNTTPYDQQLPPNYMQLIPPAALDAFQSQKFEWGKVPDWIPPLELR
ncbi:hypothetical protein BDZ94DRAFT_1226234 [Collybia nuda]|uniref:C3H1-type domain-containing protein n=1 Tax=Collybia nuda TaxID=64659 RepID=A0A9P5XXE6_9AGAR|nr:hypothetical protein BDZ94DRAFT_1226234 [Collybia nuda]